MRVLRVAGFATLVAVEALLGWSYAVRGTAWHLLLHTGIGAGLGLAAAGTVAALRSRPVRALPWAVLGQLVSAGPDLIFVLVREPHRRWMDVFVGHVSVHTAPQPLLIGLAVFVVGGWAWYAGTTGRRTAGLLLAVAAVGTLAIGLALHRPLPTRLDDYTPGYGAAQFWCR